ncbi:MAG: O-antigen ligase family protein [Rubrivivax sp.]|nr:O-antigen ligase family protein [Rubrivivax sp.]
MRLKEAAALAATVLAAAIPMLVVHWVPLGHGVAAHMLAIALWGAALVLWAPLAGPVPWKPLAPLLCALGLVALGVAGSAALHGTPQGIWLGALGALAAAALTAMLGAAVSRTRPDEATRALMWGLAVAAVISLVVAVFQLAAPGRADTTWVAAAQTPGRANANLGQPNHLALLLLWGWLATAVWPGRASASDPRAGVMPAPSAGILAFVVTFGMQAGLVATSSRAGLIASLILAAWAALDPRLPRTSAWLLWSTALGGLAVTLGRVMMFPASALGAGASLVRPGARSGVYLDSLNLLVEHPLVGVGWAEFATAWTLSPLGDRGPRYFEHAHNLPLNLAVELGLPLAMAVCACLLWGAWELLRTVNRVTPSLQPRARMLLAMLAAAGVLSGFDAPFWETHLLLPAAWAWGCAVGLIAGRAPSPRGTGEAPAARPAPRAAHATVGMRLALAGGAGALAIGAVGAWADFRQLLPAEARTLQALASYSGAPAARTRFFGHFADHQAAITTRDVALGAFSSARWVGIDTHLLTAWIGALERAGRTDESRYLMQRALEFRDPAFGPWLAECRVVAPMQPPARCQPPGRELRWTDFR